MLKNHHSSTDQMFVIFDDKKLKILTQLMGKDDAHRGYIDPDGRSPLPIIIAGIGGFTNFALDYYGQYRASGMGFGDYWKSEHESDHRFQSFRIFSHF